MIGPLAPRSRVRSRSKNAAPPGVAFVGFVFFLAFFDLAGPAVFAIEADPRTTGVDWTWAVWPNSSIAKQQEGQNERDRLRAVGLK
jgi:hypothetical protein